MQKQIDRAVFPGLQGGPHQNNIAALAVALKEASTEDFREYAFQILKNAKIICKTLKGNGFKIEFGTTENHLVLTDVTCLGVGGKQAQDILESVGIIINKNVIPDDRRGPQDPSGIRIGTPAITTRGFKEKEAESVSETISGVLKNVGDKNILKEAGNTVKELCSKFPIYK